MLRVIDRVHQRAGYERETRVIQSWNRRSSAVSIAFVFIGVYRGQFFCCLWTSLRPGRDERGFKAFRHIIEVWTESGYGRIF